MARVGITVDRALGVSIPQLRRVARAHRGDHDLALDLWATGIHEARILTSDARVRADVIRQFHERGDDGMVEVLAELEADELLRWQVIDVLRRASTDAV